MLVNIETNVHNLSYKNNLYYKLLMFIFLRYIYSSKNLKMNNNC